MADAAPIDGPVLDPWQDPHPFSSDVLPNGSNPSESVDSENATQESESGEEESESREKDDDEEGEEDDMEGEGEDEEGEDEDDYEDEEEDEPTLKYERMGGAVNDLLKKDSASALAVSNKLLVKLSP